MNQNTFNPVVNGVVEIGDASNNLLIGTNLNDQLFGLGGRDRLQGRSGMDLLEGGTGRDLLLGGAGADKLDGGSGRDTLFGGTGIDILHGGIGGDRLFGGSGDDILNGDNGQDFLSGGSGNDLLVGGNSQDTLFGGGGNDTLDGAFGRDRIVLGSGEDVVVLRPTSGNDLVLDFQDGVDKIQLEGGLTFEDLEIRPQGRRNSILIVDKPGDANDGARLAKFIGVVPTLLDEDDFIVVGAPNLAPVITSGSVVSVPENQTAVTDVQTTDDADAEGSGLTYSLTGGVDQGLFNLDVNTGVLSFTTAPDFELPSDANGDNAYEVQVTVFDSSGLMDTQDITVNVTDVAENAAPTIISDGGGATATVNVAENQTTVTDVQTTDDADAEGSGLTYSLTGGVDQGLFNLDANTGALTFNAAPDFESPGDVNGDNSYQVQVTVSDSAGLTDTQDITVNVTDVAENAAPTIISDGGGATATINVAENQTAVTDVQTSDDNDSEGSGLTYSLSTNSGGGTDNGLFFVDANTGALTFNAAPDFESPGDANGDNSYQVQVTVSDSAGLTDTQDITVNVTDVAENAAPTIISDGGGATATVNVAENQTAVTDVQTTDDADVEGSGLTYSLSANNGGGTDNGLFSIDANTGALTFNAAPDFEVPGDANGDNAYQVQVTVFDSSGLTDTQDITVTVTDVAENSVPNALNDSATTDEFTPVTINVLGNDDDPDGDPLDVRPDSLSTPANGTVELNSNGTVTYTPDSGFTGTDTFTYTLTDGNGGTDTATVTVTVEPFPNERPDATNDSATTNEDTPVTINVLDNDDDPDGDPLSVLADFLGDPANGTAAVNPNGTITYTPDPGFTGTDTFIYDITDGNGGSDFATVTVTVEDLNEAPDATNDFATTDEFTPVTINVLGNDDDPDGDPLDVRPDSLSTPANGTVELNSNGTVTYTPDSGFTGTDTFTYTLTDGNGGTDTATVTVTVEPFPNERPDATNDSVTTNEDTPVTINVLDNDDDPDGDPLSVLFAFLDDPANGTVAGNPNGTITYTPDPGFTGTDTFLYDISDGNGGTDFATVTVTVEPTPNTAPVADNDNFATDFQATLVVSAAVGVLDGDTDADGDPLTANLVTGPSNGTLTLNTDGSFEYTGNAGFSGDDSFTYVANDGTDNSNEATVTITVGPNPNSNPVAVNQFYSTFGNTALEVAGADVPGNEVTSVISGGNLLNGALDLDGDLLVTQAETLTTSEGGTVEIFSDGSFYYIPQAGDGGITDTFSFTVLDGNGGLASATASITVGDRIWYVDDDAAPGGDGTSANPFTSLAPLNTGGSSDSLDGAGDTIYVLDGTYTGGITLENNQSLLGQAVDLVVGGTTLITGSNATRPSLSSPGANAITLASGNTVRGLNITGATTQDGIIGNNVGNLLIDNNVFSAIDLEAIQVNNTTANATITVQNNIIDGTNSTGNTEIEVFNTGGGATNVTINVTGNDLNNINSAGILIENNGAGSANVTVSNNQVERTADTANGIEVDLNGSGSITTLIDGNTVTGAGGFSDAFFVGSDDGTGVTGVVNATVMNNTNTTAPITVGAGFAAQAIDNNILNLNLSSNNFTGLNGGRIFGALTNDIVLEQNGSATLNVTQTSVADVSDSNNGDTVGIDGTITFGQPAPPTP